MVGNIVFLKNKYDGNKELINLLTAMRQVGRGATGKLCIIKKCARPEKEVNKMSRYIKTPFSRSRKWVNSVEI
jgi:hypothetical protein